MDQPKTSARKRITQHSPPGQRCHHLDFHGLTCDQYNVLRARAVGHCEICGIAEEETPRGLVIDHFQGRGSRFVRGLLCDRCNCGVMQCIDGYKIWGPHTRSMEDRAREYERNSWQEPSPAARVEMAARVEKLESTSGRYTTIRFRMQVDLWDRLGEAVKHADPDDTCSAAIRRLVRWYLGDIEQMPQRPEPKRDEA